ncbi:hypothetical protein GCM10009676_44360 [Prauserella halophila]|uniref:Uncharacterized protein n=1 Tax=Prauserella halophila TaxID=185641 RepID=A0ABP4H9G3_9PSEU
MTSIRWGEYGSRGRVVSSGAVEGHSYVVVVWSTGARTNTTAASAASNPRTVAERWRAVSDRLGAVADAVTSAL